jgi:hypothetical protein
LREALSTGLEQLNRRIDAARGELEQDRGWTKLAEGDRTRIVADAGFQPIESPSVGDVSGLVAFLDETSLSDLKDRTDAIPQRLVRARTAVAQATKPQARVVRLKRATIQDGAELERYLDSLRTDIEAELGPETPVIVE